MVKKEFEVKVFNWLRQRGYNIRNIRTEPYIEILAKLDDYIKLNLKLSPKLDDVIQIFLPVIIDETTSDYLKTAISSKTLISDEFSKKILENCDVFFNLEYQNSDEIVPSSVIFLEDFYEDGSNKNLFFDKVSKIQRSAFWFVYFAKNNWN